MHCRILDEITREYNSKLWRTRLRCLAVYGLSVGLTIATSYLCGWVESYEERRSKTDSSVVPSTIHQEKHSSHEHKTTSAAKSKPTASTSNVSNPAKSEITSSTSTSSSPASSSPSSLSHRFFNYITHFISQYSVTTLTTCVTGTLSVAFSSLFTYFQWNSLQEYLNSYKQRSSYETIFQRLYAKEVQFHDQFHLSLGTIVVDQMMNNLAYSHDTNSVSRMGFVKKEDLKNLQRILTEDISELRRRASPNFPMLESKAQPQLEGTTVTQTPLLLKEKSLFVRQTSQGSENSSSSSYEMLEGKEFHNKNNVPVNEFSPLSHSLVKTKDSLPKETEEEHYMLKNFDHYANMNPIQIKSSDIPEPIEMKPLSKKDHTEGLEQEDDRNKSSSSLNSDDNLADT
jgi:hypothetical protein